MSPIHSSLPQHASAVEVRNELNKKFSFVTAVVIDSGNDITEPVSLMGLQDGPVAWFIYNRDTDPHTIKIDPNKFKIMGTSTYLNPLVEKKALTTTLNHGEFDLLVAKVRHDADIETYKYTIESDTKLLDPELDVVDP